MIYKRVTANLRAQNWSAIAIEFAIVVAGVFVGTWVANVNQERIARSNTITLLEQLRPEIRYQDEQFGRLQRYLKTSGAYADVALKGWSRDSSVTDNAFVIAAYQASQITGLATNTESWASIFGTGQVHNIRDRELRKRLIRALSVDSSLIDYRLADTAYRRNVRQIIPDAVQNAIRGKCGEIFTADGSEIASLPPTCDLVLPPAEATAAATALRAHPGLVNDLNWHRAAAATLLSSFAVYMRTLKALDRAIENGSENA